MGLLWRLFAPKGLKRARRKARKVAHPVRTVSWALSPRPVKKARRAAFKVAHPGEALEFAVENQIVRSVRGGRRGRAGGPVVAANGANSDRSARGRGGPGIRSRRGAGRPRPTPPRTTPG